MAAAQFEGKYTNFKNENLDEFYAAIGRFIESSASSTRKFTAWIWSSQGYRGLPERWWPLQVRPLKYQLVRRFGRSRSHLSCLHQRTLSSLVKNMKKQWWEGEPSRYVDNQWTCARAIITVPPQNVTTVEDNKIITKSVSDRGKSERVMEFNEEGFILVRKTGFPQQIGISLSPLSSDSDPWKNWYYCQKTLQEGQVAAISEQAIWFTTAGRKRY